MLVKRNGGKGVYKVMKGFRILILAFCILVVGVCGWTLSAVVKSLNSIKPALADLSEQLDQANNEEKALSDHWMALDTSQRSGRADYDGPEAVDASYETQEALQALNLQKTVRKSIEVKYDQQMSEQRHTATWITPPDCTFTNPHDYLCWTLAKEDEY